MSREDIVKGEQKFLPQGSKLPPPGLRSLPPPGRPVSDRPEVVSLAFFSGCWISGKRQDQRRLLLSSTFDSWCGRGQGHPLCASVSSWFDMGLIIPSEIPHWMIVRLQ